MKEKSILVWMGLILAIALTVVAYAACRKISRPAAHAPRQETSLRFENKVKKGNFWEYTCLTPNVSRGKNRVEGIVLHHTATASTRASLRIMTGNRPKGKVSCHVIIAPDGTRYILAPPEAITWHAGYSTLNGRDDCNRFTIGIEFQGNTGEKPLTDEQIQSAIDYCLPIMKEYRLTEDDIVTHRQIRQTYLKKHPWRNVPGKPDITEKEHRRFLHALARRLHP